MSRKLKGSFRFARLRPTRRQMLAAGSLLLVLGAIFAVLLVVRQRQAMQYSGDEPHYLIVTESLMYDGDVDVKNQYEFAQFRPFPDPPNADVNYTIFTPTSPHWYSACGVGLPAIIYPGVVAGDSWGGAIEMVFLCAVLLVLTFYWARRFAGPWPAGIAAAVLGVSAFFLGLEGRIFPDLLTAMLLVACLLLLEVRAPRAWHLFLLSCLIGISPWVHFKNGFAFATIAVIAVVLTFRRTRGQSVRRRAAMLALVAGPALVSAIGYELSILDWYGSWNPTRMSAPGRELFSFSPLRGLAANSFDGSHGLLVNNPAMLLLLAGLPAWYRLAPEAFLRMALVIGPSILLEATFNDWSGGYAPPGRYAMQFVPVLIPAVAVILERGSRAIRAVAAVLIGLQWALAGAFVWLRPTWTYAGAANPLFTSLKAEIGVNLNRLAPTFDISGRVLAGHWQLLAWYLVAAAFLTYGMYVAVRGNSASQLRPSARPVASVY